MANPLMPAMLNQILLKQGRKISHTPKTETMPLKKAQEDWLRDSILKPKTPENFEKSPIKPQAAIKMVTLESLRGELKEDKKEAPKTDREKIEKTMVTLASIGKLYRSR